MKMIINFMMMILIIQTFLIFTLNLASKKTFKDFEKSSPFECGFNPKTPARFSFSLHFFLIAVIFLIFDMEITLLLPMILSIKIININNFNFIFSFFILALLMGLYYEWYQKALNWKL